MGVSFKNFEILVEQNVFILSRGRKAVPSRSLPLGSESDHKVLGTSCSVLVLGTARFYWPAGLGHDGWVSKDENV